MGRMIPPCNAKEGWFYKKGRFCSKCHKCPGGHGRDMTKQVLNTTETQGDLECTKCEVCPANTYNNGGREGCNKCLDNCAIRNRHDCPEKATHLCGECLDGHYEEYNIPDNPSTCIPCTAKDISVIPACANLTTLTPSRAEATFPYTTLIKETVADTTRLNAKTTKYSYIHKGATPENGHVFGKNDSAIVQNKAVEAKYDNSAGVDSISLLAASVSIFALLALFVIWMIRYYKKRRRRRQFETDANVRTVLSSKTPLTIGTSQNSVDSSLLESTSGNSVDCPLPADTSGNSEDEVIVIFDDLRLDNELETDSKPVPKEMDRNRWIHRQELLKSKVFIHQLCAKSWISLDREYQVLCLSKKDIQLLEKEAHNRCWPPAELNFKILAKWTQVKGNQATVQALCDALFANKHYDIIEDIMKENQ
ncbi:hypothetical protein CHS0354_002106 [Potamilus streckersoni]|uniref:Death domain-containing protein n=1 Tax=Potamilus streckersoni TaxID=2493646 RepID=A0AAE0TIV9_9BIVA|nr:hypothetical protein CHS0354_002106 [Potamilus streckersoni]